MEGLGGNWKTLRSLAVIIWSFGLAAVFVSAERNFKKQGPSLIQNAADESESNYLLKGANFLWQSNGSGYQHVWPEMKFNWQIIVASVIGFFGAAFGSVGGVGGGGIFIPMLTLIIGFDPKSATAISKFRLYTGRRVIASNGESETNVRVGQMFVYCSFGVLAGVIGGLLGLGGGFIMAPVFLELGIPPQVSSATATFGMMFSSSMSVVEYYLLNRFPVPYALYLVLVATIAAFVGQDVVRRVVDILGRASVIIFILASTIFISAISLGGVGIVNMIGKIQRHEYMGFENLCTYGA